MTPSAWAFRTGEQFTLPTRDGRKITYLVAAHGVLDGVRTYLLVTLGRVPVAMRIEREERLLAMRDRQGQGRWTASGDQRGPTADADINDARGDGRMRAFVLLAECTPSPADGAPAREQVLGFASGIDQSHAFLQLVRADQNLLATHFDEVICLELVSDERRYLYLHDVRPADDDSEAQAMFKRHLLSGEPLSAEEVQAVVREGLAQATDFDQRGGGCHWYAPAFPDDMEG